MNQKQLLFVLTFAVFMFCLIATLASYLTRLTLSGWGLFWLLSAASSFAIMLRVWLYPDKVPDVLAKAGWNYFEREGFCFVCMPTVRDGRCQMDVLYQNRYDKPCVADVLFRPDKNSDRHGLPRLQLHVKCDGAGDGKASVPWDVPPGLQGREVTYEIGANVRYPDGQGQLVRFKDGMQVGSTKDLKDSLIVSEPARIELIIPSDLPEAPSPISTSTNRNEPVEESNPRESVPDGGAHSIAMPNPIAPAGQPDPRQIATGSIPVPDLKSLPDARSALNDQQVESVLAELNLDPDLRAHAKAVRRWKQGKSFRSLPIALLSVLIGGILLALGNWVFENGGRMPIKIWAIVLTVITSGGVLVIVGLFATSICLQEIVNGFSAKAAMSPLKACRDHYAAAIGQFDKHGDSFAIVCHNFPTSVLESHRRGSRMAAQIARDWGRARKQLEGKRGGIAIDAVTVAESPRTNPAVVDLTVSVRGRPFGVATFQNVAICTGQRWLLVTPIPVPVEAPKTDQSGGDQISV